MDAFKFFDTYTLRARIFPALIATASVIILLSAVVPWQRLSWAHLFASAGALILLYGMADLARRLGKALELELIRHMGGLPSTTMMRHSDDTFDGATKARMHQILASKVGANAPTATEESADPAAADSFYASCGHWLRENTRDHDKFGILFDENIAYGFRRNLLGLRVPAFVLDAMVITICAVALWFRLPFNIEDEWTITFAVAGGIAILHAVYFVAFVTRRSVFAAARVYARQLLLSCETFQASAAKPAEKLAAE
jgi:hypothetical protein